jgi:putative phosphoesterase
VSERLNSGYTVTVGVLADTHLPYRMQHLPGEVFDIFRDVDLILHAGDVDRIEYLDDLAALAPFHAVRGNLHFMDLSDGGRDLPVELALAPFHAVRGNLHFMDLSDGGRDLPVELQFTIAGRRVVVNHGGWFNLWSQAGDWLLESVLRPSKDLLNPRIAHRLAQLYPEADLIVFGHSHRPYRVWRNRTLFFNPGAVCPTPRRSPSVGKLYLGSDAVDAEIIPLG